MNLVAELVGVTLGPRGRNVVLQNKYGPPKIVNDGETVLKQVIYLSPFYIIFVWNLELTLLFKHGEACSNPSNVS